MPEVLAPRRPEPAADRSRGSWPSGLGHEQLPHQPDRPRSPYLGVVGLATTVLDDERYTGGAA